MRLRSLRTQGWRNLADGELVFSDSSGLIVLSGDNAQGKTNLLEAIYFLSVFRSFRTPQIGDLVAHGAVGATVLGRVRTLELERSVEAQLAASRSTAGVAMARIIRVDGKVVQTTAKAFGLLGTVLFVPEDLALLRAPPSARRRFLDLAVSGVERSYFAEASDFQRVLRSRNALLKARGAGTSGGAMLDTYDEQLAHAGARVVVRRRQLIAALAPHVRRFFSALHADLEVSLVYRSEASVEAAQDRAEIAGALVMGLRERRQTDVRRGHTTFGPQLDDFEIGLGGRPAREHASQGQLRSLMLALKLAELANVEATTSEPPVLLLDDVPSELDPSRRRYLFETLDALECQTFLTVADAALVPTAVRRFDFRVHAGRVTTR